MVKHVPVCVAVALTAALAVTRVPAQELSRDEIVSRLKQQMEAINHAQDTTGLGAARGLVLSPAPGETAEVPLPDGTELVLEQSGGEGDAGLATIRFPDGIQINVQITFAFDSAAIDEAQRAKLREICGAMEESQVGLLRIVGHTDAAGPDGYNQQLSVLRAEEVQRFFVGECGIDAARLEAVGNGERFPLEGTDAFADSNRRVEFQAIASMS